MSPLESAAILGLIVTAWHLPLVLMGMLDYLGLPTTFVITFVYCWLFNRAGGSVLITLVFHAAEGSIRLDQLGIPGEHLSSQTATYAVVWAIVAAVLVLVDRNAWRSPSPSATNTWPVSHAPPPRAVTALDSASRLSPQLRYLDTSEDQHARPKPLLTNRPGRRSCR